MSTPPTTDRSSARWLDALRASSLALLALVGDLPEQELNRPSFAGDWTVAQVLSHLGSAAEICAELVRRGLAGEDRGPQREEVLPIWERWNALPPVEQRAAWREADQAHLELLGSVTADQEAEVRVPYFAGPMTLETYLGYRLSEQAVHGWDAHVAFDGSATVAHLDLLWERLDLIVSRFHASDVRDRIAPRQITLLRHDSDRPAHLVIGDEVHLVAAARCTADAATLGGTSGAILRLIYGRSRPEDSLRIAGGVSRDELQALFPGF